MTDSLAHHTELLDACREAAGAGNVVVVEGDAEWHRVTERSLLFVRGVAVPEVEHFVSKAGDLNLAVAPVFGGLCVVWPRTAPYAQAVADVMSPWDRNPLLERLELNRVGHLDLSRRRQARATELHEREQRTDELLRRLASSRTLRLAGLLSRLRGRGRLAFSADRIRRVLGD